MSVVQLCFLIDLLSVIFVTIYTARVGYPVEIYIWDDPEIKFCRSNQERSAPRINDTWIDIYVWRNYIITVWEGIEAISVPSTSWLLAKGLVWADSIHGYIPKTIPHGWKGRKLLENCADVAYFQFHFYVQALHRNLVLGPFIGSIDHPLSIGCKARDRLRTSRELVNTNFSGKVPGIDPHWRGRHFLRTANSPNIHLFQCNLEV